MTAAPALYPTKTRLALAGAILAGQVRHYPWTKPLTMWRHNHGEHTVTARVAELMTAGYAEPGPQLYDSSRRMILTPAGILWMKNAQEVGDTT